MLDDSSKIFWGFMSDSPLIRHLGLAPYEPVWRAMQKFTDERQDATRDEIWFVEHPPVFTLGLNASREHVLAPGDIPVVQIDRGGQVTYHGPGQLMIYPLLNLRRLKLGVRDLVVALENAVIAYAANLSITASGSQESARRLCARARSLPASDCAFAAAPAITAWR